MKILKNEFKAVWDRWDDPGDYPNGAASYPLPSYDFIEEIDGAIQVEMEEGDTLADVKAEADIPSGVKVLEWEQKWVGKVLTLTVSDFEEE